MWVQNYKIVDGGIWLPREELERLRKEQRKLAKAFFDTKHMYWEHKARKEMCDDLLNLIPKEPSSAKEETHTLREWQAILANNPELMAEFEKMNPPKPIK